MSTDAKAVGYLELNIAGFEQAIETAKKAFAGMIALFGAKKIEDFFVGGTKEAINFGNAMYFASQKLGGLDPGKILLVQKALQATYGLSGSDALNKLKEFQDAHRPIASAFGGEDKFAAAIQHANTVYGAQAKILDESADQFKKVYETMEEVGSKLQTFFLAATQEFLKPLQKVLDSLNTIDLSKAGKEFGDFIAKAFAYGVGLWENGTIIQVLKLGITLAFEDAIILLVGWAKEAGKIIGDALDGKFNKSGGDLAKKIKDAIQAAGKTISDALKKMGDPLVKHINKAADVFTILVARTSKLLDEAKALYGVGKAVLNVADYPVRKGVQAEMGLAHVEGVAIKGSYDAISKYMTYGKNAPMGSTDFGGLSAGANAIASSSTGHAAGKAIVDGVKSAMKGSGSLLPAELHGDLQALNGAVDAFKATTNEALVVKQAHHFNQTNNPLDPVAAVKSFYQQLVENQKKNADALDKVLAAAKAAGDKYLKGGGDDKGPKSDLDLTIPTGFRTIAGSLARIGGGGGVARMGMDIAERQRLQQTQVLKDSLGIQKATLLVVKNGSDQKPVLH